MTPFASRAPLGASVRRPSRSRAALAGLVAVAALALGACEKSMPVTVTQTPPLDGRTLEPEIARIADRARPARLGVALINLESGEVWTHNGARRFPMQSVFKAPLGAAVLAEVDAGRLSLDEVVVLEEEGLSPPYSPVSAAWPARRDYTVRELLVLAAGGSDNTAADVLMRRIGGPGALTAWLASHKLNEIRVDRYERQFQTEIVGLASFRPEWRTEAAFTAALARVPAHRREAAMTEYLKDPRDTSTPRGMAGFFAKLDQGELLSPQSTSLLLQILTETKTGQDRLKAGLPDGAALAHKTGSGRTLDGVNPATNDAGVVILPDGRRYALAVFLSGSTASAAEREAIHADVARAVVRGVR